MAPIRSLVPLWLVCLGGVASAQVLFQDDLSDGLSKWGDPAEPAGWKVEDGALVRADPNGGAGLALGDNTWEDYIVEFRLMRTQVLEGGHNGIVVRNANDRRCHIFLRPDGLRYEMPPVTETGFAVRPLPFELNRWYRFRLIVQAREVAVEVDDVYQGTVGGLSNPNGGIAFGAYRVALKLDDVKVTAIPKKQATRGAARPEALLDPGKLDRGVTAHVVSTSQAPRAEWPVVCRVGDLALPPDANLTSLTAFDAQGKPLPSQWDDTDLSGGPTPEDEFCFSVTLPPASLTPVALRFDASSVTYRRAGPPAVPGDLGRIVAGDYAVTWTTKQVEGRALNEWAQYHLGAADGPPFFLMKPWDGEQTAAVAAGPVRTVWTATAPLEADGLLTRRLECYPRFMRMVARLAPQPGRAQAAIRAPFWGGVGTWSFHWGTPMVGQVKALRWRDAQGYGENLEGGFDRVLFPRGGNGRHLDLDLGTGAVMTALQCANDYDPGSFLVGLHQYAMGHLHFGWRAPIMVWAEAPSLASLTVKRIPSGREAFEAAEEELGSTPRVLSETAAKAWVAHQARLARLLREASPASAPAEPRSLPEAVRARAGLERLDFPQLAGRLDRARRERITQLAASPAETTPACALLRRMQPVLTAARWDWNAGRFERAIERLAWARSLAQRAEEQAKSAPRRRLAGRVPPGPIVPYVTIAGRANQEMADLGLTVSHDWMEWSSSQPKADEYDWREVEALADTVNRTGMSSVPLLNFSPAKWFGERYPGFGLHELVDPKLLGYEPEPLQAFGRWVEGAARRFDRAERIVCWSVRNEPSYLPGGPADSPLMLEAMRKWLARRYGDIAKLNEVWGTQYARFEEVESPKARDREPAAWYDLARFKAEAIAGELGWEADLIQRNSRVKRTGGKFVPTILDASGVRGGMGPDPWTAAAVQRGAALCDLYTDSDWQTYRLASESWFAAGGSPVISAETGLESRPRERRHRWVRYPDERQRSFAWSALQFGLYGVQYWTWGGAEEYGALNWDGTVPDDVIRTVMANQERLAAADLLSTLKPVTRLGLYYPQATFIDAAEADDMPHRYAQLFNTLTDLGYQVRNFSFRDIDRALAEVEAAVLPPAPYVEAEIVAKLRRFVQAGGKLLAVTEPALWDEHLRPLNAGRSALADVIGDGGPAVSLHDFGKGKAAWIREPVGLSFGRGAPVVNLATKWRFRFGLSWPEQGMTVTAPPPGAEDAGAAQHWEWPAYDDSGWAQIPVPGVWEENGYPDLDGHAWYRLSFDLPAEMKGRRVLLTGDTLDDRAWVYVNGQLVRQTQSWDESFQEEVTRQLRPGARNVIALRILDHCFRGGVRGRLTLTSPDLPTPDRALLAGALRSLGLEPQVACTAAGVVRRLMRDGAGQLHLLYTNETSNALEADLTVPVPLTPATGELVSLLEGRRFRYETARGKTVVHLTLGPDEIGLLPLKPVER